MKLYIKNMVCGRCKMVVKSELEKLGLQLLTVNLGEVETVKPISDQQNREIADHLKSFGFELIDDKKDRTINKIKTLIIELVHHQNNGLNTNLSVYLSSQLLQDYTSLSNMFSAIENTTIEKYFISQKIEKVKELLMYNEMTLSEIASEMNYSSVAYLSNQFKKVTGQSPSLYKQNKESSRSQLDDL